MGFTGCFLHQIKVNQDWTWLSQLGHYVLKPYKIVIHW